MGNSTGSVGRLYLLVFLLVAPALAQSWDGSGAPPTATGPRSSDVKRATASGESWHKTGAPPAATGPRPDDMKPARAAVQHWRRPGPAPTASGPLYDVSVGYSHLRMPIPGAGRINLNGIDASAQMAFKPHWGLMLDSNYVHTANVLGTKHIGYALNFLGGPVFYPVQYRNTRLLLHALAGIGTVDGAAPASPHKYFYGWQSRFSYAFGGGVEQVISGPLAIRLSGDYLRTAFYNPVGTVMPQNNLRLGVSFVFRLNHWRRERFVR